MNTAHDDRHDAPARDGRPDWLTMEPTQFDTQLPMTQGALFAKPDPMGTPALFGDAYGADL